MAQNKRRLDGRGCRNKGKRGEREVINKLLQPVIDEVYEAHGLEVPVLQRNTLQSDRGGADIVGLDWFSLEVKYHNSANVNNWWRQTVEQASRHQEPVLLYRLTGQRSWTACLLGWIGGMASGRWCRVTVCEEDFLAWFRSRLVEELDNEV